MLCIAGFACAPVSHVELAIASPYSEVPDPYWNSPPVTLAPDPRRGVVADHLEAARGAPGDAHVYDSIASIMNRDVAVPQRDGAARLDVALPVVPP